MRFVFIIFSGLKSLSGDKDVFLLLSIGRIFFISEVCYLLSGRQEDLGCFCMGCFLFKIINVPMWHILGQTALVSYMMFIVLSNACLSYLLFISK